MTFDIEFEEQILSQCLKDTAYLRSAASLLQSYHFADRWHGWIWEAAKDTWSKCGERLTPRLLISMATRSFPNEDDRKPILELASKLYRVSTPSPQATLNELREFVRFVNLQSAFEMGLKSMEKGDMDKAYDAVRKATSMDFKPKAYKVTDWIEQFDARMAASKDRRDNPQNYLYMPTGLKKLDNIIDGLRVGEVGLIIGTTGMGKSITLNHMGFQSIIRGTGVLHMSLEMSDDKVAMRYDSRFTGVLHKKFKQYGFNQDDLDIIASKIASNKARLEKKLRIVSTPLRRCDIDVIRGALQDARGDGIDVKQVIVDSGDHMKGVGRFENIRLEQTSIYWDLKGLAEEEEVGVWSSTHAGRDWEGKAILRTGAGAESYDKERIADIVITLNDVMQSSRATKVTVVQEDEPDSGKVEQVATSAANKWLEMYLAKYRDGEGKIKIPLETEFAKMLIKEAQVVIGAP
jgi:replicative DNA helicase